MLVKEAPGVYATISVAFGSRHNRSGMAPWIRRTGNRLLFCRLLVLTVDIVIGGE